MFTCFISIYINNMDILTLFTILVIPRFITIHLHWFIKQHKNNVNVLPITFQHNLHHPTPQTN